MFIFGLIMFLIMLSSAKPKRFYTYAGPFEILLRRAEKCPRELDAINGTNISFKDTRTKITEMKRYKGTLVLPFVLNNSLAARFSLASWNNVRGWQENAHFMKFNDVCTCLNFALRFIWHKLLRLIFGEVIQCPMAAALYRFENFTFSSEELPTKYFVYGRWRADVQMLYSNGDVAACLRGFIDTVPK